MEVIANKLYNRAMCKKMSDGHFEWLSEYECNEMGLLLNNKTNRIAIFDSGLFDHRENENYKQSFIFDIDLEYSPKLHNRDDDYPLGPKMITIKPDVTGKNQHICAPTISAPTVRTA